MRFYLNNGYTPLELVAMDAEGNGLHRQHTTAGYAAALAAKEQLRHAHGARQVIVIFGKKL